MEYDSREMKINQIKTIRGEQTIPYECLRRYYFFYKENDK